MDELTSTFPVGAKPLDGEHLMRICPGSKHKCGKHLNFEERSEFCWVCQLGADQLIDCYGAITPPDTCYNVYDFAHMCSKCPYVTTDVKNRFGKKLNTFFYPYFIEFDHADWIDVETPRCFVYFISDGQFIKIGVAKDVGSRIRDLQVANARQLELIAVIPCKDDRCAKQLEMYLHNVYSRWRISGEWFSLHGIVDWDTFQKTYPPTDYMEKTSCQG